MNKLWLVLGIVIVFLVLVSPSVTSFVSDHEINFGQGISMFPTFSECTLLVVNTSVDPSNVIIGDIVVIDPDDEELEFDKFAHRVIINDVENQLIATRGDNNAIYDFPSSVDGFFGYNLFVGKVEQYFDVPTNFCRGNDSWIKNYYL